MSQPSSSFSSAGEGGGGWGLCRSAVLDYVEVLYYDYALLDIFFFGEAHNYLLLPHARHWSGLCIWLDRSHHVNIYIVRLRS